MGALPVRQGAPEQELLPALRHRLAQEVADRLAGQLGVQELHTRMSEIGDQAWGCGPLQPLVDDPVVTDVLLTADGQAWVDRGGGLERSAVRITDQTQARALAVRLATAAGRRLDESMPWVDARLAGGLRLHAIIPPVSPHGVVISIRVLRRGPTDLATLRASGSLPAGWDAVLTALIARRAAFLITGGTGTGKTTLLSALLRLVPHDERIVLVEDVGELQPDHPHVVRLEARHANVEGRGEIGLDVLVRQALRMRPDRIVVGECRGAEIRDLLAALNTGHSGGCGTLHANAATEVPARLEALALAAGMTREGVHAQAVAALDAVVHLQRRNGQRCVAAIAVVDRDDEGRLNVLTALDRDTGATSAWPLLAQRLGLTT